MVFDATVFAPPPPRHFPRVSGSATAPFAENVRFSNEGVPPLTRSARGVKRLGLNYERRVLDVLSAIYGTAFRPSPMIYYTRHQKPQRAIPDGLLYVDGPLGPSVLIIEVKLAHTASVWDQLMERYAPLVSLLHPRLRVRTVEICRSYDPAIPIPHTPITSLHRGSVPGLEVMRWRL